MPVEMLLAAIFLPFFGTVLGGILFLWNNGVFNKRKQRYLNAAAGGIMFAAAIWSLLIPSVELSSFSVKWLPTVLGFLFGGILIALLEKMLQKTYTKNDGSMLMLAVTIHNFPEGMAVGVALSGLVHSDAISLTAACMLSFGIAVQNIPEGAIIYAPIRSRGKSKLSAMMYTVLSGIVEPLGALLTFLLTAVFEPLLPFILAFAAGAMIYVVADEMLPAAAEEKENAWPSLFFMLAFSLMMLLDIALG